MKHQMILFYRMMRFLWLFVVLTLSFILNFILWMILSRLWNNFVPKALFSWCGSDTVSRVIQWKRLWKLLKISTSPYVFINTFGLNVSVQHWAEK